MKPIVVSVLALAASGPFSAQAPVADRSTPSSAAITFQEARRAGPGHPWQARVPGVNLDSRAKLTDVPIVAFSDVAGMPFVLTLHHSSRAVFGDPSLGPKWTHTFDTHLRVWREQGVRRAALVHGDQRVQLWERVGAAWTPRDGYLDELEAIPGGFRVLRPDGSNLELEQLLGGIRYRLARIVDRNGNAIQCGYTGGRLTSVIAPSGRGCHFVYDENGKLIRIDLVSGSLTRSWSVLRDASGGIAGVRAPQVTVGSIPSFFDVVVTVDLDGNVTSFTDRSGATTSFGYDPVRPGELETILAPGNAVPQTLQRPAAGATTLTDELGVATTWVHDGLGRETSRTLGSGAGAGVLTRLYDDPNHGWKPSALLNAAGDVWAFDHDARGRTLSVTPPGAGAFDYSYDGAGRLVQVLEPQVTDAWGVTEPLRHRTELVHDARGNPIEVRRFTSAATHVDELFSYDGLGRLVQRTDASGRTTSYGYDAHGNLVSMTSPAGRILRWLFEDETSTLGFTVPNAFVDGLGRRGDFVRDEWGRLLAEVYPDGSGASYEYDAMNRLVRLVDAMGTSTFSYTPRGLLASETRGATATTRTYAQNGLRLGLTVTAAGVLRHVDCDYTAKNELARVIDDGLQTLLTWDADSRLIARALPNGARMERSYLNGLLADVRHYSAANALLASYAYSYQTNLGLKSVVEQDASLVRYRYDALNRLVQEERAGTGLYAHEWWYDPAGRRLQTLLNGAPTSYVLDPDGLPVQVVPPPPALPQSYVWDGNGRLATFERNGTPRQLLWDFEGHVTALLEWNGGGFQASRVHGYDGLDRRVLTQTFGPFGPPLSTSAFTYDGARVVLEDRQESLKVRNVFAGTWGQGLISYTNVTTGQPLYPLADGCGALRGVTGGAGTSNGYAGTFDAFGLAVRDTGQRPPFAQLVDDGVFTDPLGLLAAAGSLYDSTLGGVIGTAFGTDAFGFASGLAWPLPPPTGVFVDPLPLEILPLELVSCGPPLTVEDVLELYDTFTGIKDPVEHGVNGAAFLIDVVVEGPATASDRALSGEFGGALQGASTIGHLFAGETDKILQVAETNALGQTGIWLGEKVVDLWWWATGKDQ